VTFSLPPGQASLPIACSGGFCFECPYFVHGLYGCWREGESAGCCHPKNYKNCPLFGTDFVKKPWEAKQKGGIYDYENAPDGARRLWDETA
jgi:hypothetical protein